MKTLQNNVALVTGGSRGIGRAVALRLAEMGAFVYVNYLRNRAAAAETLQIINKAGGEGKLLSFDVSDFDTVHKAMAKMAQERSRIDILVNNAGVTLNALLVRMKEQDWDTVIDTNLKGVFNCSRAALRYMIRQRWGRIVNIVSVVAEGGNPGQACYAASKAGIMGITKSLAREVGSRNICVNAVAPGFIETEMTASIDEGNRELIAEQIPLGRIGDPADVAGTVAFLVSRDADYITGQVIRVNGGLYM